MKVLTAGQLQYVCGMKLHKGYQLPDHAFVNCINKFKPPSFAGSKLSCINYF